MARRPFHPIRPCGLDLSKLHLLLRSKLSSWLLIGINTAAVFVPFMSALAEPSHQSDRVQPLEALATLLQMLRCGGE